MEKLQTLTTKNYQQLRHDIRSGDILLCSGHSIFSTLIRKATNSIWSHVAFVLRVEAIDRVMVLESVESIGVRTIPLSSYVNDYNGTGRGYPGKLLLARHEDVKAEHIIKLSRKAVDLLGYPYGTEEIAHIAARISMYSLGLPQAECDNKKSKAFICSEYADVCFSSIGINITYNPMNYIAPADFANHPKVKPLCYLYSTGFVDVLNAS